MRWVSGSVPYERWWNILPEMFGRKPWVRWPPASSDMPSARWLPNLWRRVSHCASDISLMFLRPSSASSGSSTRWARIDQKATRLASMPECGWTYAYSAPNSARACSVAIDSTSSMFWQPA